MKRYHPVIAIILGYFIASIIGIFLPDIPLSEILAIFIFILGGFIATYLSWTNIARIGFYEGIVYSIGSLIVFSLSKSELTFYSAFIFILIPILGLIGGFIAKTLRLHMDNENN